MSTHHWKTSLRVHLKSWDSFSIRPVTQETRVRFDLRAAVFYIFPGSCVFFLSIINFYSRKNRVRMAERSKAPDSRWLTLPPSSGEYRYSGLHMKAWVQIPLLTSIFKVYSFLHWRESKSWRAPSEVRTHDLEIMRLARCQLRYRGMHLLL